MEGDKTSDNAPLRDLNMEQGETAVKDKEAVTGGPKPVPVDVKQVIPEGRQHPFMKKLTDNHEKILYMLKKGDTKRKILEAIGCARKQLDEYIKANDDLAQAWDDAVEAKVDLCEEIVLEIATISSENSVSEAGSFPRNDGRVMASNLNAAKLFLERMGAKRGWNPKIETCETGNGGGRAPVIIVGTMTEEMIADGEAMVTQANLEAEKGLEGIPRG